MSIIDRYVKVLEFYANEDNWTESTEGSLQCSSPIMELDRGTKAREILQELPKTVQPTKEMTYPRHPYDRNFDNEGNIIE